MQLTVPADDRVRLLRCIVACQQSLSSLFEGGGGAGGATPSGGALQTGASGGNTGGWGESHGGMVGAEGDTDPLILRQENNTTVSTTPQPLMTQTYLQPLIPQHLQPYLQPLTPQPFTPHP